MLNARGKARRRRYLLLGSGALVVVAAIAGLAFASTGADSRVAETSPVPDMGKLLRTDAPIAEATVGANRYVLAPGVGQTARDDGVCFAVLGTAEDSFVTCGQASAWEKEGALVTEVAPDGTTRVWGFVPSGATNVAAGRVSLPLAGRFFNGDVPTGVTQIRFVNAEGESQSLPVRRPG
jgi:hypothetical protein